MSKGERVVLASIGVSLFLVLIAKWVDNRAHFAESHREIGALRTVLRGDPSDLCTTDRPIGVQDALRL